MLSGSFSEGKISEANSQVSSHPPSPGARETGFLTTPMPRSPALLPTQSSTQPGQRVPRQGAGGREVVGLLLIPSLKGRAGGNPALTFLYRSCPESDGGGGQYLQPSKRAGQQKDSSSGRTLSAGFLTCRQSSHCLHLSADSLHEQLRGPHPTLPTSAQLADFSKAQIALTPPSWSQSLQPHPHPQVLGPHLQGPLFFTPISLTPPVLSTWTAHPLKTHLSSPLHTCFLSLKLFWHWDMSQTPIPPGHLP